MVQAKVLSSEATPNSAVPKKNMRLAPNLSDRLPASSSNEANSSV